MQSALRRWWPGGEEQPKRSDTLRHGEARETIRQWPDACQERCPGSCTSPILLMSLGQELGQEQANLTKGIDRHFPGVLAIAHCQHPSPAAAAAAVCQKDERSSLWPSKSSINGRPAGACNLLHKPHTHVKTLYDCWAFGSWSCGHLPSPALRCLHASHASQALPWYIMTWLRAR